MSGGFFRGTSADQDTRFSNKQAKLLKSQKFAPELEHLVDMTKVKMDVIRPWIATRVTELLGFEDEVLINFIYGLLDGKEVNGKEVQISLTGFMEKNTVKFMKELWTLLISAQKNESGVPQQFLDAKAEETRKKQAEADRMMNEIQKKKEKESKEFERERLKKTDGSIETEAENTGGEQTSKHMHLKISSANYEDEKEADRRNGVRGRSRASPSRVSRSFSNSSYSGNRQKLRSISRSPEGRGRSISSSRMYHSPRKRSATPRQRHSPRLSISPRRRSSYSRRRSRSSSLRRSMSTSPIAPRTSPSLVRRRRSPSPIRRRRSPSPIRRRRSPSPIRRRRSPSPVRRRRSPSPVRRRRSPSPVRRRRSPSPVRRRRSPSPDRRRRSPSPDRRRRSPSPNRRRRSPSSDHRRRYLSPDRRRGSPSPVRHRRSPSPFRHRESPSPAHRRRSPSPIGRRRSPSPVRRLRSSPSSHSSSPSPVRHMSPPLQHKSPSQLHTRYQRSSSTSYHRSSSPMQRRSSPLARKRSPASSYQRSPGLNSPSAWRGSPSPVGRSPIQSPMGRVGSRGKLSPLTHQASSPSPLRKLGDRNAAFSPSQQRSGTRSVSPVITHNKSVGDDRRSSSPHRSPARQRGERITQSASLSPAMRSAKQKPRHGSPETSKEDAEAHSTREGGDYRSRSSQKSSMHSSIGGKVKGSPVKAHKHEDSREISAGHQAVDSRSYSEKMESRKNDMEMKGGKSSGMDIFSEALDGQNSSPLFLGGKRSEGSRQHINSAKNGNHKSETKSVLTDNVDHNNGDGAFDSGSEELAKRRTKEKRKHKRSHKQDVASDDEYSDSSDAEDRKEAKRRRKEEKKLRKEEKRRRREERRRRREERRSEKLKSRDHDDASSSHDERVERKSIQPSDEEGNQSDQKRLEIELRKKALESLKAKKGISH